MNRNARPLSFPRQRACPVPGEQVSPSFVRANSFTYFSLRTTRSSPPEKVLHEIAAGLLPHPPHDPDVRVKRVRPFPVEHPYPAAVSAEEGIPRPVHDRADPGLEDGTGAHRTRLEGHV